MKKLTLPYPISVNQWTRSFRNRQILTAKAREYRKAGLATLGEQTPMLGNLSVTVELYPVDRRRRDIDSPLKALLDLLTHARVYDDDSQIKNLNVIMHDAGSDLRGLCIVTITENERY